MADSKPEPTVHAYGNFNATEDATSLRAAMKGLGTDEETLIEILTHRSESQRQLIAQAYKEQFGRELIDDLKSELSGRCEAVLVALVEGTPSFLAKELHDAIEGAGTAEDVLIDVLCSRTNNEIAHIVDAYQERYEKSLEEALSDDTSGHFRRLLIVLVNESRRERDPVDEAQAKLDAEALYNAGEGMMGTDESVFNSILSHRSARQLRLVFREYSELSGKTIEQAIRDEVSGSLQEALLTIVESAQNRPAYFAKRLHKAMKGAGTEDNVVIRIIVTRAEIDLRSIAQEYMTLYDRSLESAVGAEVSGLFKDTLISLLG